MFCEKCGSQLEDGSKFCQGCGAKIETEYNVNPMTYAYQQSAPKLSEPIATEQNKKKIYVTVGIITALIIVLAIVVGCLMYYNGDAKKLERQLALAEKYIEEEDYDKAIAAYEAAIKIDKHCVDAYEGLVEAYCLSGEYEEAVNAIDDALIYVDSKRLERKLIKLQEEYLHEGADVKEDSMLGEASAEETVESTIDVGKDSDELGRVVEISNTEITDAQYPSDSEIEIGISYYMNGERGTTWLRSNDEACTYSKGTGAWTDQLANIVVADVDNDNDDEIIVNLLFYGSNVSDMSGHLYELDYDKNNKTFKTISLCNGDINGFQVECYYLLNDSVYAQTVSKNYDESVLDTVDLYLIGKNSVQVIYDDNLRKQVDDKGIVF